VALVTLAACGGGATPSTKPTMTNNTTTTATTPRNDVVKAAVEAMASGDIERLMTLADPKGLYEYAFSCKDSGDDVRSLEVALREEFQKALAKSKGSKIEVVSIKNEMRAFGRRQRERDRNATFIAKGGSLSKDCTAKTDMMFHEVEVRLNVSTDGQGKENRVKLDLVHAGGRWFVSKVPKDLASGSAADSAVAKMEQFQTQMCNCKDKACADQVNEDMTKWGTEMARSSTYDYDDRPDPDLARKSADIMTKYTECMTKLMMAGAGSTP
jgi:hypothetical protein